MDRAALPPTWLEELLELLQTRRRLAVVVAAGVAVLGVLLAAIAPGILPASGGVGAAVGLAACLLAVAAVVGIDAGDLKVRGARHVRAAGADVQIVLRGQPQGSAADAAVTRLDGLDAHRVAIVPADAAARGAAVDVVDALGEAWARAGRRVLVMDLTRPDDSHAGIVDVARGTTPLGEAVTFDPELMLARLGAGNDLETALVELPALAPRLPADIERVVVALPPLVDPAARSGASAIDHVLVLARSGRTTRVDLLATLEALDVGGVDADVLLHTPEAASPAVPASVEPSVPDVAAAEDGDETEATGELPPVEPSERAPRPVLAARDGGPAEPAGPVSSGGARGAADLPPVPGVEGDAWAPADPEPPTSSAADPVRAHLDDAADDALVDGEPTVLLGLAEIDREVEADSRWEQASRPRSVATIEREDEPVITEEPVVTDEPEVYDEEPALAPPVHDGEVRDDAMHGGAPGRPQLRAVAHDVVVAPPAGPGEPVRPLRAVADDELAPSDLARDVMIAPVHDLDHDELATTAVLETLAQEIWSRDDLGGTA